MLRFGELLEQQRNRLVEDCRRVAVRDRVPQEILRPTKLVVRLAVHGELNPVAFGRERLHLGASRRRR